MDKIKILLADDHQMFLDGLTSLLSQVKEVEIVGAVNDGSKVIEQLKTKKPDLVILDLNMPVLNGLETTKEIKKSHPQVRVLGLTMDNDLDSITGMLEAGASGYILKNTGKAELELAIQQVMAGRHYLSQSISTQLAQNLLLNLNQKKPDKNILDNLTEREIEILKMIALEHSNTEIANLLFISPKTVETHRKNLMRKIGVKNSLGVYKFALKNKLVEQ